MPEAPAFVEWHEPDEARVHVPRRLGPGNFTPSLSQIREVLNTSVASSPRRARNDLLPSMQLLSIALKDLRMPERQVRKLQEGHITEVANGITTLGFSVPVLVGKHNEAGTAQAVSDHREAARPMTFNAIDLPEQRPPLMRSAVTASRRLSAVCGPTMRRCRCRRAAGCRPRLLAIPPFKSASSCDRRQDVRLQRMQHDVCRGGLAQGDASLTPVQAPKTASLFVSRKLPWTCAVATSSTSWKRWMGRPPRPSAMLSIPST